MYVLVYRTNLTVLALISTSLFSCIKTTFQDYKVNSLVLIRLMTIVLI